MSDEKDRNLPLPGICIDPGYTYDKLKLPKGNFSIEMPVDSFYNFVNNPENNKQAFEDLIKSLSGGGLLNVTQPPTVIGTKHAIDQALDVLGTVEPVPYLPPLSNPLNDDILDEFGNKIMLSLGVPMDMISTGHNKGTVNKAVNVNGDMDALRNEMNILKEKNNKYLELIQVQANALKDKDKKIENLKQALNASLERELQYQSGSSKSTTVIQPPLTSIQNSTSTMNMGSRFGIRR